MPYPFLGFEFSETDRTWYCARCGRELGCGHDRKAHMKAIAKAFYDNPVIALGVLQVVATGLAAYNVIAPVIALIAVGIIAVLQRELVTPDPPADARLARKGK